MNMTDLKDIRKTEENRKNIDMFFDDLPNRDMNIEDEEDKDFVKESKGNKQDKQSLTVNKHLQRRKTVIWKVKVKVSKI